MAALPYEPTRSSSKNVTPRVLRADLGDGYTQRAGDGINTKKQMWSVTFEAMDTTSADTLIEFFEDLAGVDNFTWTPFRQTTARKFICTDWNEGFLGNSLTTITASFEEVFDQ